MADAKEPAEVPEADKADSDKPMIITHRAVLKEPAAADTDPPASDTTTETKPVAKPSTAIKLKPLEEPKEVAPEAEDKVSESESIPVKTAGSAKPDEGPKTLADIKKPEAKSEEAPAPKEEAESDSKPAEKSPETGAESAQTDNNEESDAGKPVDPAAAEAEEAKRAKHDAEIQKLADSKQYYLPINAVEKRKTKRFIALGVLLSLLLVVFWVDVALDAGLIHLSGIKPLTHFFSN